jgi:anti-anti-sigma factor
MISIIYYGDYVIVSIRNLKRIDFLVIENLKNHLLQIVENSETDIYVDLKEIKFIDSHSFAGFKFVSEVARQNNTELYFLNVSNELTELFRLADENNELTICIETEVGKMRVLV